MTDRVRVALAGLLVAALGVGWWLVSRPPSAEGLVADVESALTAWAEYAGSGDITPLPAFFADGPQLAQLRSESAGIIPGPPYRFELTNQEIVAPGIVRGVVTVSRPGEPDQSYRWDIEAIEEDGAWKVWTVRTSP
ncbi:MAG: hypothetical protein ACT4OP_10410 [Actinomycetota bacterium]